MKEIALTNSNIKAMVDDEDFDKINQYRWKILNGYAYGKVNKKNIFMHRFITNPRFGFLVDHKNGNRLDNQKNNLRECLHCNNGKNTKIRKNNTSGYKGVKFIKKRNKFESYITSDYKYYFLGYYNNAQDAAVAYNNAATKYHGGFANLNTI